MSLSINLTIDDFDPLIAYTSPIQWTTPNPQDNPSWFNQTQEQTGSVWHEATYHQTSFRGAEARFNFTGDSLDIYGFSNTSYQVIIDPSLDQPYTANITTKTAVSSTAESSSRASLFSSTSLSTNAKLTYAQHEVVIRNVGLPEGTGVLGLDYIVIGGIPVGGEGATLTNTTVDDNESRLRYTGDWTTNNVTDFWGGSSAYTDAPLASVSLNFSGTSLISIRCSATDVFTGSAIYVYGDQVNDHGYYAVYINDTEMAYLTGRSGCASPEGDKSCEKLGGLHFFAGGLPEGEHDLRIENGGTEQNRTYFDLDRITYTTPSNYSARVPATDLTCPFVNCTATASTASSASSSSPVPSGTASSAQSASATPTSAASVLRSGVAGVLAASVLSLGLWISL
ncbi:hypothetical protein NliqN6_0041 [Naganishia liquefaciens]|uniref:Uncharacterized protein n=1 Tax=Naganishia liquefaciens TaxID=104408 RepID=A0A8H3TMN1_9TREE|nr:hypothetical protein NliqN6_0041 [Naganishia liquefaciens]